MTVEDIGAMLVRRAKTRILTDCAVHVVPEVEGFAALHEHVDANMYLLDEAGDFDACFDGWDMGEVMEELNKAADVIDEWLRAGALRGASALRSVMKTEGQT